MGVDHGVDGGASTSLRIDVVVQLPHLRRRAARITCRSNYLILDCPRRPLERTLVDVEDNRDFLKEGVDGPAPAATNPVADLNVQGAPVNPHQIPDIQ